jgi:hypothetical protein
VLVEGAWVGGVADSVVVLVAAGGMLVAFGCAEALAAATAVGAGEGATPLFVVGEVAEAFAGAGLDPTVSGGILFCGGW